MGAVSSNSCHNLAATVAQQLHGPCCFYSNLTQEVEGTLPSPQKHAIFHNTHTNTLSVCVSSKGGAGETSLVSLF